ncbi:alpha/beta fold hydrolase [Microbacterium kyungheense]|uniref:Pimeloyl-ACP methyl ester carboxylesterase n=1 Tax=Microbacterium kyungheense TaxID=1263636 RepID=A0A543EFG2_9MICO|nr:alpha/beta hydrolase [Microbacterium kyungheense]TQM20325.1 pimeloyl-ACP methyl ester carboxylesterase [Microbacterium kyungheense]
MTERVRLGDGASLAYEAVGSGIPLLSFHGAYSARGEVREFLEPMISARAVRRVYLDLPGHGDSRPSSGVRQPDDVLDLIELVLEAEVPVGRFLVLGHSFGGHVARAIAARHPDRVAGMALICPVLPGEQRTPAVAVVRDDHVSGALDPDQRAEYEGYFVVRTADTLDRFRSAVVSVVGEVDEQTIEQAITPGPHRADPDAVAVDAPVLVVSGRHDHWVGWERQERLGDRYPHATVVTAGDAGHALPHERPGLVAALLSDWLDEVAAGG